jgi:AraC-like DNA-binding protein
LSEWCRKHQGLPGGQRPGRDCNFVVLGLSFFRNCIAARLEPEASFIPLSEEHTSFSASSACAWSARKQGANVSRHAQPPRRLRLRLGAAAFIPELLEEQGLSAEVALGRAGFTRRWFAQAEPIVPLGRLGLVFKCAAAATAQAEFGLLVGLRAGTRLTEAAQRLPQRDTRVSAALMQMIARPETFPHALLTLSVSGTTCTIGCLALPDGIPGRDQLTDCAIGFATGALRVLCGPRWRPRGFHFEHAPPPDPPRPAALLQAPMTFHTTVTAMEFESEWLGRDCLHPAGQAGADGSGHRFGRDFAAEVRTVLASWNAVDKPSAPAVAASLGVHPRTLNRLLGKTGTRFNRMLGDTRYETAQRMLRDPATPVISIAWSLGYADASAFSRAFRRWSGMTPSEWRRVAGGQT